MTKPKPKLCGAIKRGKSGPHVCQRPAGHPGPHVCGCLVADVPLRECGHQWIGKEKGKP